MVIRVHCTGDIANYEKLTSFLEDLGLVTYILASPTHTSCFEVSKLPREQAFTAFGAQTATRSL